MIRESKKRGVPLPREGKEGPIFDEYGYPTEAARRIFVEHVPEWAELFLEKNSHYGDTANFLGAAGQFSDINRKFWPLKRILWDHRAVARGHPRGDHQGHDRTSLPDSPLPSAGRGGREGEDDHDAERNQRDGGLVNTLIIGANTGGIGDAVYEEYIRRWKAKPESEMKSGSLLTPTKEEFDVTSRHSVSRWFAQHEGMEFDQVVYSAGFSQLRYDRTAGQGRSP